MKAWIRMLALALVLGLAFFVPTGLADVAEWAETQDENSALQRRIQNQRQALGAEVNTAVKAQDITSQCKVKVSEGSKERMLDNRVGAGWSYSGSNAWVGISLPSGVTPGAIRIEWRFEPEGYEVIEYDADRNVLRTRTLADTFPSIYTMMALLPETKLIQLKMTVKDQVIVNLKLYSEGVLPDSVQTWLPPVAKADMMVVSTHQDDEVIFLGGTIPYSDVVCARPTVTVYMTNCSRSRRREALECLWEMGSRTYPEFINLKDERVSTIDAGLALWGGKDNILRELVARIRRYKPEVIVTQDFKGEYGHRQHIITANAMPYAVKAAADPGQYPDSYQRYGAWQVKKLYIHLYSENEIRMDWLTPQPACGGLTLLKVAQNGMAKHASQLKYYSVKDGGQYDNSRFGLYMTTVGEDAAKNDFFENIPRDASAQYLAENPAVEAIPAATVADGGLSLDEGDSGLTDGGLSLDEGDSDLTDGGLSLDEGDSDLTDGGLSLDEGDSDLTDGGLSLDEGDSGLEENLIGAAGPAADAPDDGAAVDAPATGAGAAEAGGSRGGIVPAVALIGAGVALAGGGAWALLRHRTARRRRGRARTGSRPGAGRR